MDKMDTPHTLLRYYGTKMSKLKCKKVTKNNFRILKKAHAYLQTISKASVKFQKDKSKTVGEVTWTRWILPIHFCGIIA